MFEFIDNYEVDKNVNLNYIREIEENFQIKFPNVLKDFYLKYNYSNIKECEFDVISLGSFCAESILSLKYGDYCFEKTYTLEKDWLPKGYIPFATDIDGDHYYWNTTDEKVYYISHEDYESPILICNNVEEFFSILNKSCKEEILIPDLNVKKISNIDNPNSINYEKVLKYNGKLILFFAGIFLSISLYFKFYIKPINYSFINIFGVSGILLLLIDLNRRINSIIALKKYDINLLDAELKDGTKMHGINAYLTKNYIISNSKGIRITKYDDIKWIYVPTPNQKNAHLLANDIAYRHGKTPIVAYLKNKKKVTIALVKLDFHIKQIFNRVNENNNSAMIGNTQNNKIKYESINSLYKLKNKIWTICLYALCFLPFIAIIISFIINK